MVCKNDIGFENCMGSDEIDVKDFVAGLGRSDSAELSPTIREAVFDQLEYDLSLTLYQFERRHIRNSELLQLIKGVAATNKFSVATYVREAVLAEHDRKVAGEFLKRLSERAPYREWYDTAEKREVKELRANSVLADEERALRANRELLVFQH